MYIKTFYLYVFPKFRKSILTLVIRGLNIRNIRDRYGPVHIILIRKNKLFGKMSNCLSVRKISVFSGFLFVWKVHSKNRNFCPIARRLTKLKPNEIFNDSSISREPINEIDPDFFYLKDID